MISTDLPPIDLIDNPPIAAAAAALDEWRTRLAEAARELDATQHERDAAQAADTTAAAGALRDGKADPGPKRLERHLKLVSERARAVDALQQLVDEAAAGLEAALAEHGADWTARLRVQEQESRAAYAEALDRAEEARTELAVVLGLGSWRGTRRWGPHRYAAVTSILGPNGEPLSAVQLTAALRELASGADTSRAVLGQMPRPNRVAA